MEEQKKRTIEEVNKEYNEVCHKLGYHLSQARLKQAEHEKGMKEVMAKIEAHYSEIDKLVEEHKALETAPKVESA